MKRILLFALLLPLVGQAQQTLKLGLYTDQGFSLPVGYSPLYVSTAFTPTGEQYTIYATSVYAASYGVLASYAIQRMSATVLLGYGRSGYAYRLSNSISDQKDLKTIHKQFTTQLQLGYKVLEIGRLSVTPQLGAGLLVMKKELDLYNGDNKQTFPLKSDYFTFTQFFASLEIKTAFDINQHFSVAAAPFFNLCFTDQWQTITTTGNQHFNAFGLRISGTYNIPMGAKKKVAAQ